MLIKTVYRDKRDFKTFTLWAEVFKIKLITPIDRNWNSVYERNLLKLSLLPDNLIHRTSLCYSERQLQTLFS